MNNPLRDRLVSIALEWQQRYGVAPHITAAISEYDAAMLVGFPEREYSRFMQGKTAVAKGSDFEYGGIRYQVKANRPSGKPGSRVTLVANAAKPPANTNGTASSGSCTTRTTRCSEAWQWDAEPYRQAFSENQRLSPEHYRYSVTGYGIDFLQWNI